MNLTTFLSRFRNSGTGSGWRSARFLGVRGVLTRLLKRLRFIRSSRVRLADRRLRICQRRACNNFDASVLLSVFHNTCRQQSTVWRLAKIKVKLMKHRKLPTINASTERSSGVTPRNSSDTPWRTMCGKFSSRYHRMAALTAVISGFFRYTSIVKQKCWWTHSSL